MVSALDPYNRSRVAEQLHQFLDAERNDLISQKVSTCLDDSGKRKKFKGGKEKGSFTGNRLMVWLEGHPEKLTKSWSNKSQCQYAIHLAIKIHQSGIATDDGRVPSVLILTPYSQATSETRRMLKQIHPAEYCAERVSVRTIDDAQGAEADFVVTAFINTKGGFL